MMQQHEEILKAKEEEEERTRREILFKKKQASRNEARRVGVSVFKVVNGNLELVNVIKEIKATTVPAACG
jgi:hypothetical protein